MISRHHLQRLLSFRDVVLLGQRIHLLGPGTINLLSMTQLGRSSSAPKHVPAPLRSARLQVTHLRLRPVLSTHEGLLSRLLNRRGRAGLQYLSSTHTAS